MKPLSMPFVVLVLCAISPGQSISQNPVQQPQSPTSVAAPPAQANAQIPAAQSAPPQTGQTQPCGQHATGPTPNHASWTPPKALRDFWGKQRANIQNKTGIDVGSAPNSDFVKPNAAPCAPASSSPAITAQAPSSLPASATGSAASGATGTAAAVKP